MTDLFEPAEPGIKTKLRQGAQHLASSNIFIGHKLVEILWLVWTNLR
jgi:hypothetical protein